MVQLMVFLSCQMVQLIRMEGFPMKRSLYTKLIEWVNRPNRKPLILWGARQVGKTYLVREMFAKDYFPNNSIYIDFRSENIIRDFCSTTVNASEIMNFISVAKNKPINSSTLLIFDEIQECPSIITSLKYFHQDYPQIPVIATGSMVRIKLKRIEKKRGVKEDSFLFPIGKINQLTLYPMTFEEFLINHNESLYQTITTAYQNQEPLSSSYHELALDCLYKYLLIGGMPEAVHTYLETGSLQESRMVLKDLYDNYLSDMDLYQASPEAILRSRNLFTNLYRELNRESKNFSPSLLEKGAKVRDYLTALDWLELSHIVYSSKQLPEHITLPLTADNDYTFRLFLADVGMFAYQSNTNPSLFLEKNSRNTLSGIFMENYVATELVAKEIPLFYWRGKNNSELEFIVAKNDDLFPIDVKKSKGSLPSIDKFKNHNKMKTAIKISANNYGYDSKHNILTIPLYEVFLLANTLQTNSLD